MAMSVECLILACLRRFCMDKSKVEMLLAGLGSMERHSAVKAAVLASTARLPKAHGTWPTIQSGDGWQS